MLCYKILFARECKVKTTLEIYIINIFLMLFDISMRTYYKAASHLWKCEMKFQKEIHSSLMRFHKEDWVAPCHIRSHLCFSSAGSLWNNNGEWGVAGGSYISGFVITWGKWRAGSVKCKQPQVGSGLPVSIWLHSSFNPLKHYEHMTHLCRGELNNLSDLLKIHKLWPCHVSFKWAEKKNSLK